MVDNPLWQYSLSIYQRPAVADLCLALQDDFGADVNMLLSAAWLSTMGQPLSKKLLSELLLLSRDWQKNCLAPLRKARQYLKHNSTAEMYQMIKRLEVSVEAMQQQALYQCLQHLPLEALDDQLLSHNLRAYLLAISVNSDEALVLGEALCQAIRECDHASDT